MASKVPEIKPGSQWLLYARDSGHEKQAASCDQQLAVALQVLAENGAALARDPYVDRARKGSSTVGRAELERLLAEALPGVADGVMFWSSARMARDINDAQHIRSSLRRNGYTLFFISDNIPNIGKWTPLLEVAKDIANMEYLEQLSQEVKRGQNDVLAAGGIPSGRPSTGYMRAPFEYRADRAGEMRVASRWVKDPALAERVRQAWEMRLAGHSYPTINARLELYSDYRMLSHFFRNPIYKGTLVWGGRTFPGKVEPYVTEDEWEQVQRLNDENAKLHPRTRGSLYLLRGLIYCGQCGRRMRGTTSGPMTRRTKRYSYYKCADRWIQRGTCRAQMVRAEHIEERVLEAVDATYLDAAELRKQYAEWEQALAAATDRDRELAQLQADLTDLARRIARLLDEVESGASVGERLAQREAERAQKQARLESLRAQPAPKLLAVADAQAARRTIRAAMEQGDRATAQLYLSKLVGRVDVFPDGPPRVTLRPPVSE